MKLMTMAVAVAATMMVAHSAQARVYHHRHYRHHYRHEARRHPFRHQRWASWDARGWRNDRGWMSGQYERPMERISEGGYGPRPREWCGWEMRHLVGGDPGPSYNLARNWAHWGHSGPAGVGAIVVWPHHVGKIVGREGGEWVVKSGNDGHTLRTRPRSIAGAIAVRWG
ncbi:MAG: hypothetical protein ACRECV_11330 [Xanthobacteraceae bacterium]